LVDAGLPFSETRIRAWAEKQFGDGPNSIVLTHGHFDHVSAAEALADHWDVPILAHELEAPYLQGAREYPAPNVSVGGGLMTLLSPLLPRGPVNLGARLRTFTSETTLAAMPGWDVIHTPGHTPGHVSLFRPRDGTLIVGDAFCTTKPESFFEAAVVQHPELHGPPGYFTWNPQIAQQSIRKLAGLNPRVVAPGHGKPLAGAQIPHALGELAANVEALVR
jgi:glyoxylase-like metal-dependent hydrolase (beta-lactamase superfamily II)